MTQHSQNGEGVEVRDLLTARQLDRSTEAGRAAYRLLRRLDGNYHSSTYTEREDWIAVFADREVSLLQAQTETESLAALITVTDTKGFITIHEPNEDGDPGDLVASVWRDDWLNRLTGGRHHE